MYSFKNDYSEGAHPNIINTIIDSNYEETDGYGEDVYSEKARMFIQTALNKPEARVHFFSGGTATNLTALSAFLRPHEAVIAVHSGHILVHETGAIEATGHKVISIENTSGKLTASEVEATVISHGDEHMVKPRLVYISNSTEFGGIYAKKDMDALRSVCDQYNLYLYMDGARLGSALTSEENDLTLGEIASYCDAFYIGGTKNGALIGEALVICNKALQTEFRYIIKQRGAMLAKGRLIGIQFYELFKNNLFFELAQHANKMAYQLRDGIIDAGYDFLLPSPTNQLFPIMPNSVISELEKDFSFYRWSIVDENHSALRLVTSWATTEEKVQSFIDALENIG